MNKPYNEILKRLARNERRSGRTLRMCVEAVHAVMSENKRVVICIHSMHHKQYIISMLRRIMGDLYHEGMFEFHSSGRVSMPMQGRPANVFKMLWDHKALEDDRPIRSLLGP